MKQALSIGNQRPRHAMVVQAYYPFAETRVEREAKALLNHGYAVDVICLGRPGQPAVELVDGVEVHRALTRSPKTERPTEQFLGYLTFMAAAMFKLARLHRERHYRTVQAHNLPDFLVFAALVPKLSGSKVILDLHDLMPEFFAARFGTRKKWLARLVRWQEKLSCAFADQVITVTELWRQTLIARGIPADKISVVMNVADDAIFRRNPADQARANGNGHYNLIYHGTLTRRYGLDLAIRAVDLVRHEIPGVHLTLHGWGDDRGPLKQMVDDLGLQDYVSFSTEGMPASQLPEMIRQADVAIVPYRRDVFTDGILPTKLMEYAAVGVPVIAARTTAISAYFDDNMVEFFAPEDHRDLASRILTLYLDRERRQHLVEGSEQFLEQYNWTRVSSEYTATVDRLGGGIKPIPSGWQESKGG